MATVNGITAEKAQQIEDASVVSGEVNPGNGHLILTTAGGTDIDAGVALDLTHPADTSTHGVGEIVGTTETQTVSGKTLVTPTIASFVNANHNHSNAAGGGALSTFSGVKAVRTATQTIADSTNELLNFSGTSEYDTASFKTSGTTFTIPVAGYYEVLVNLIWEGSGTGRRVIDIRKNDTTTNGTAGSSLGKVNPTPGHATPYHMQAGAKGYFAQGDTIKVIVAQFSGGNLNTAAGTADAGTTYISINKMN